MGPGGYSCGILSCTSQDLNVPYSRASDDPVHKPATEEGGVLNAVHRVPPQNRLHIPGVHSLHHVCIRVEVAANDISTELEL